jgi:hypothetical protein
LVVFTLMIAPFVSDASLLQVNPTLAAISMAIVTLFIVAAERVCRRLVAG